MFNEAPMCSKPNKQCHPSLTFANMGPALTVLHSRVQLGLEPCSQMLDEGGAVCSALSIQEPP